MLRMERVGNERTIGHASSDTYAHSAAVTSNASKRSDSILSTCGIFSRPSKATRIGILVPRCYLLNHLLF